MAKHIAKIASSTLILLMSLNACGLDNTSQITQPQNPDNTSILNNPVRFPDSNPAPISPEISSQISSLKIEDTEWGLKVKSLPTVKAKRKATLLSYLAFDNDKGGYRDELRQMINFHELSGSSNVMNMVLQTDGADDKDLKRYFITGDKDATKMVSPYTAFKYERDSADYRVLKSFIKWGFSTYPSDIKLLDIDSHGGAYMGVGIDDTSGKVGKLPSIAKAIKEATGKVDLLNFDACLMGSIEVLYELKDTADIIIGSQDSTYGTGLLYTKSINTILEKYKNLEDIARDIVLVSDRKGKDSLTRPNRKGYVPNVFTISAYRISQLNNLTNEINNLSNLLIKNMPTLKQTIKVALDGTHPFNIENDELAGLGGQRDLHEILQRLNTVISDVNIKSAISKTTQALNKTIILARIHNAEKYAQGMAINI
ncbi:MAG: clostripain-related cysteine peptidase, partial [Candidatus Sericytochromatia bacterium]